MTLIPNEAKVALSIFKSIDISLGRIATALEKQNGIEHVEELNETNDQETEQELEQKPKKSAVSILNRKGGPV